jgi:hypothetical protein
VTGFLNFFERACVCARFASVRTKSTERQWRSLFFHMTAAFGSSGNATDTSTTHEHPLSKGARHSCPPSLRDHLHSRCRQGQVPPAASDPRHHALHAKAPSHMKERRTRVSTLLSTAAHERTHISTQRVCTRRDRCAQPSDVTRQHLQANPTKPQRLSLALEHFLQVSAVQDVALNEFACSSLLALGGAVIV